MSIIGWTREINIALDSAHATLLPKEPKHHVLISQFKTKSNLRKASFLCRPLVEFSWMTPGVCVSLLFIVFKKCLWFQSNQLFLLVLIQGIDKHFDKVSGGEERRIWLEYRGLQIQNRPTPRFACVIQLTSLSIAEHQSPQRFDASGSCPRVFPNCASVR